MSVSDVQKLSAPDKPKEIQKVEEETPKNKTKENQNQFLKTPKLKESKSGNRKSKEGKFENGKSKGEKLEKAKSKIQKSAMSFGESIKANLKERYEESDLGKTVAGAKSLVKKFSAGKSEIKKETTTLKDQIKDKPQKAKPQGEIKKEEESKPGTAIEPVKQSGYNGEKPKSSAPDTAGNGSTDKGNEPQISSQDIQDIKGLLTAINLTLSGPLLIKDNKPFRPKSNMLD